MTWALRGYRSKWIRIDVIGAVICLGLALLVHYAGIAPLMAEYDRTAALRKKLEDRRQEASSLSSTLAATRAQTVSARQSISTHPLQFQPAKLVNNRIAEITDLATAAGLEIEAVQPGTSRRSGRYEIVPIRVSGAGTYPICTKFLHSVRQKFPDTAVAGFGLGGNPSLLRSAGKFEFDLEWHALPTHAAPPPITPLPPANVAGVQ